MSAASLAFHAFLALLPIVIALVGLFQLVGLSSRNLHSLLHATSVLLPSQMSSVINKDLLSPSSRQAGLLEVTLGSLVALWSSIEALAALQIALDVAYEVSRDRGFLGRRLAALPLLVVTIVFGGVASLLLVLGTPLERLLPRAFALVRPEFQGLLALIRYGGALVLLVLLLSTYYSFGPARQASRLEWISPGAVVAALGWTAASVGFSFYLDHFGHETRTYGALAGVAVTLLWMFLAGVVMLFGAELNRELERVTESGGARPG